MCAQPSPVQHWDLGIGPVSCHCWNKDRTQLAASASNNIIYIFELKGSEWKTLHVLEEHDLLVTGLDWAPNTNRIVSCSQDKNAFVWTHVNGVWKPELVLVRSNRAATSVKWSPQENKFAVATGARLVSVCYYEKENDWWVSKHLKKPIRSTATSIDWHPNNVLIAVGACDFKVRVFSAYIKEIENSEKPAPTPWGSKMPFGQLMAEYSSVGWVHDVAFSASGCRLAWVSHDSSICVIDKIDGNSTEPIVHRSTHLPFASLIWASENNLVAAGHDCSSTMFCFEQRELKLVSKLDVASASNSKIANNQSSAFKMFKNFDRNAIGAGAGEMNGTTGHAKKTLHQNAISYAGGMLAQHSQTTQVESLRQIQSHSRRTDSVTKFSTSGLDGLLALWDVQTRAR